jgi:hypothetical protein
MLPGFRFLFAAVILSMSILVFGLGAAALLRAAHEKFAANPTWRAAPEPVFAQQSEATKATLAMMRVDPPLPEPKPAVTTTAFAPTEAAPSSAPETENAAAPTLEAAPVADAAKPDLSGETKPETSADTPPMQAIAPVEPAPPQPPAESPATKVASTEDASPAINGSLPTATSEAAAAAAGETAPASTSESAAPANREAGTVLATEAAPTPAPVLASPPQATDSDQIPKDQTSKKVATRSDTTAKTDASEEAKSADAKAEQRARLRARRARERRRLAAQRALLARQTIAAAPLFQQQPAFQPQQPATDPFAQQTITPTARPTRAARTQ